jgi:hypothetical protein
MIIFISSAASSVLLINDVEVLVNNGNLTNMLSSNQAVSDLFKSPNKENICSTNNFIWGVCEELIHIAENLGTSGINIL